MQAVGTDSATQGRPGTGPFKNIAYGTCSHSVSVNKQYVSVNKQYVSVNKQYVSVNKQYVSVNKQYVSVTGIF